MLNLIAALALSAGYSGHGAQSVAPEVLQKYAPPALPEPLARQIQSMLDVRAPSAGTLSPDGKRLFFSWAVTGTRQLWRIDGPMQFPQQLTGGQDATGLVAVAPNGKWLLLSRDRKGEENPGLYVQPVLGGELQVIQHKAGVQTRGHFVSDDSRYVYYSSNDVQNDSYALYRYDIEKKAIEKLFDEPGLWAIHDHKEDGRLLLAKATGSLMTEYFELEPKTKALTPLFGQGQREDYSAQYTKVDGELVVKTNALGEYSRLYLWKAGKFSPITPELNYDVDNFEIDHLRTRILYTVNEGGYTRLFALDAKTQKPLKLPALPAADHVLFGRTTHDGRHTTLAIDTGTAPVKNYVLDWKTQKLSVWNEPSAPEIDTTRFVRATIETYPARDGTQIPMLVRRPQNCAAPCPVVVQFHGGPEGQAMPGFNAGAQLIVDAGFVLVEPNVRGSDGYGKRWLHADDGAKRLSVVTDIEDVAIHIRKAWAANGVAPKIGVIGGSYGGYSTLVAMTMFAGAYDVGVSNVGIANLVTFLENTAPYRRKLRTSEYGDLEKDRDVLVKLSPTTYIDKLKAPLMLIQGATDPRVPVGEALLMHQALEAKKIQSPLIIFADEGHGAQKRENRVYQIGHTIRFLQEHLQGKKSS